MANNKFIKGVNKFKGADQVIYKIAYYQSLPENKNKLFTVHFLDESLGLMDVPVTTFLEGGGEGGLAAADDTLPGYYRLHRV